MINKPIKNTTKVVNFFEARNLLEHQIFKRLTYWIDFRLETLDIKDEKNRKELQFFINLFRNVYQKELRYFIKRDQYHDIDKLKSLFKSLLYTIDKEILLLNVSVRFLLKFKRFHEKNVEIVEHTINAMIDNRGNLDDSDLFNSILDLLLYHFISITINIEEYESFLD